MNEKPGRSPRSAGFRSAIAAFIDARREAKLKGREDGDIDASKYDYDAWLEDAARRVTQIQAVTHVLKATHPDARGSSLHVLPSELPPRTEIGTHSLHRDVAIDVVGNAAALDVFKFLRIEVEDRQLLDWVRAGDADLATALNADPQVAEQWMQAFGSLVRTDAKPVSHPVAKQVYWLVGDDPAQDEHYHLLQPMFSSSLAHAVHADIQDARFGEQNKLARAGFRAREPHDAAYRDYRNLAFRKLGGSKPQNISQLTSERGGVSYLLASLPPIAKTTRTLMPLSATSALTQFGHTPQARRLVKTLADFLLSDPPPIQQTRDHRKRIEQALGSALVVFAANVQAERGPGWTSHEDCALEDCEKLWLDPGRLDTAHRPLGEGGEDDQHFESAYHFGDWPDEVAGRFANWVNAQLHHAGLTEVGDVEYRHWARQAIVEAAWPVPQGRRSPGVRA